MHLTHDLLVLNILGKAPLKRLNSGIKVNNGLSWCLT